MRTSLGKMFLVGAMWTLLCGFQTGRFEQKHGDLGEVGKAIDQVRALIRPLYEVRGALFLLRVELAALSAPPEKRALLDAWSTVSPATAGWAAMELEKGLGLSGKKQKKLVSAVVAQLTTKKAEKKLVRDGFSAMLTDDALKPGGGIEIAAGVVGALTADQARLSRIVARIEGIGTSVKALADLPAKAPAALGRVSKALRAQLGDVKAALAGDAKGALGVLGAALVLGDLKALMTDVKRIPKLVAGIPEEGKRLSQSVAALSAGVTALPATAAGLLAGLAPSTGPDLMGLLTHGLAGELDESGALLAAVGAAAAGAAGAAVEAPDAIEEDEAAAPDTDEGGADPGEGIGE